MNPKDTCDFASPLASDFKITLESSARLYAQAQPVMELLLEQVVDTGRMVLLADNKGTILRTVGSSTFMEQAARVALRPGMCWAEASKGTNAIGTALMLESEFIVHSNEHFIQSNHFLTCSAAPIMDHSGNVVGILDVSGDERSFHPHTLGLVKMSARNIENYWFCDNFSRSVRLHFHTQPELIGTVAEGIIAIGAEGKVLGVNRAGLALLHTSSAALRVQGIHLMLGLSFAQLMDQVRSASTAPLKIQSANGLVLYARAHIGDPTLLNSFAMAGQAAAASCGVAQGHAPSHTHTAALGGEPVINAPVMTQQRAVTTRMLSQLHHGDAQMQAVADKVRRALDKNISIMVLGETGSGKEWLANAIHHESKRRLGPLVVIDCAALPEHLMESELFGSNQAAVHEDKSRVNQGKLLQAHGGTLFLDEIGDMPMALQARMLRVLQERSITLQGAADSLALDVQLICSTHRNMREMVSKGAFREDLYYRLNGLVVKLPALRVRGDFVALCHGLLAELSPHKTLHVQPELMLALQGYVWPGNLRQLSNVLRTGVSLCAPRSELSLEHMSDDFREDLSGHGASHASESQEPLPLHAHFAPSYNGVPIRHSMDDPAQEHSAEHMNQLQYIEAQTIHKAVLAAGGNISKAAKQLNISRNTVYRKLKASQSQRLGASK